MTYLVTITRQFFGKPEKKSVARDRDGERAILFATRKEAEDWIEATESHQYRLGDGESSAPDYRATPVSAAPAWARQTVGLTGAQRQAAFRARRRAEGGRQVNVILTAAEAQALARLREAGNHQSDRDAIGAAIMTANQGANQ